MADSADDEQVEIEVSSDSSDIVASPAARQWWNRRPVVVGLAGLAIGALLGYLAGVDRAAPAATPAPSASVAIDRANGTGLTDTGLRCSDQVGAALQLGIAVANRSVTPVRLVRVRPTLPLGGLVVASSTWSSCGEQFPRDGATEVSLDPGATSWVTITFNVQPSCPAALPVLFNVVYSRAGQPAEMTIAGFNDLGDVPYTGCRT